MVGTTGAAVASTGAAVGSTGEAVGSTGAADGTTGACDSTTGAGVGATGAGVGATGAAVPSSTLAASASITDTPDEAPTPLTVALMGPSGASEPSLLGPKMYVTLPGHNAPINTGAERPPMAALSFKTTSNKHSSLERGTVIW